eukprot:10731626-Alexandrium_andersonii.AAC.1
MPEAARSAGAAARAAEAEKALRYPAERCRGVPAWAIAVETIGHMGTAAEDLLAAMAAEASRADRLRGAPQRPACTGGPRGSVQLRRALSRAACASCYASPAQEQRPKGLRAL